MDLKVLIADKFKTSFGLAEEVLSRVPGIEIKYADNIEVAKFLLPDEHFDVVVLNVATIGADVSSMISELRQYDGEVSMAAFSDSAPNIKLALSATGVTHDIVGDDPIGRIKRTLQLASQLTRERRATVNKEIERNRSMARASGARTATLDSRGHIDAINDAWREFSDDGAWFGDMAEATDYLSILEADANISSQELASGLRGVLNGSIPRYKLDYPWPNQPGLWFSVDIAPLDSQNGGAVISFLDISDRKQTEEAAHYRAMHDSLTGLPNRALFLNSLQKLLEKRKITGRDLAVLFLDLNKFKIINDTKGHKAGDIILKSVADRAKRTVRPNDMLARLGGDEFVVLCPDVTKEEADAIAERISVSVRQPVDFDGEELEVTVSIGIAFAADENDDLESLMERADAAMYRAKNSGRGSVETDKTKQVTVDSVSDLHFSKQAIQEAMSSGALQLFFQPRVSFRQDGRIVCLDTTVRYQHPDLGLIREADFIPFIEEQGIMGLYGWWLIRAVCERLQRWSTVRVCPPAAIPLTLHDLAEPKFVDRVSAELKERNLKPHQLRYEFHETNLAEIVGPHLSALKALHSLGVSVSIVNFGSGDMPVAGLRALPADSVGIDSNLLAGESAGGTDETFVRAFVEFAHALKLTVFAENIDTATQKDAAVRLGIDHAQGYLLAPSTAGSSLKEIPEFLPSAAVVDASIPDWLSQIKPTG